MNLKVISHVLGQFSHVLAEVGNFSHSIGYACIKLSQVVYGVAEVLDLNDPSTTSPSPGDSNG